MSEMLNMTYNSQKEILNISEYGRNVQNLVNHCKTIEDDAYRQAFAEKIVALMWQMNPTHGPTDEARRKFWKHFLKISDGECNINLPEGVVLKPEAERTVIDEIVYPDRNKRLRQYGANVQKMFVKAMEMEDEEKKLAYLRIIGSFMKLAYKNWSREHYVNDEIIKADMKTLSKGAIIIPASMQLDLLNSSIRKKKPPTNNRKTNNRGRHSGSSRSNNNYQNRRRR